MSCCLTRLSVYLILSWRVPFCLSLSPELKNIQFFSSCSSSCPARTILNFLLVVWYRMIIQLSIWGISFNVNIIFHDRNSPSVSFIQFKFNWHCHSSSSQSQRIVKLFENGYLTKFKTLVVQCSSFVKTVFLCYQLFSFVVLRNSLRSSSCLLKNGLFVLLAMIFFQLLLTLSLTFCF